VQTRLDKEMDFRIEAIPHPAGVIMKPTPPQHPPVRARANTGILGRVGVFTTVTPAPAPPL